LCSIIFEISGLPVGDSAAERLGIAMEWHDLRHIALAHQIFLKLGSDNLLGSIHTYSGWQRVMDDAFEAGRSAYTEIFG